MWDRLKQKISHFLFEEKDENDDTPSSEPNHSKQDIRTKMTYQYPAQKPFRFPVIPDQPNTNDETETPAFQRKRNRAGQDSNHEYKPSDGGQEKARKVLKPESAEPFTPTDVPSPIYGFQQRHREQTIDSTPALQRREADDYVNEPAKDEFERSAPGQSAAESETDDAENMAESDNPVDADQADQKTAAAEHDTKQQSTSHNKNRRSNRKQHKQQTGAKTPPFNVMMSANDKQNQRKNRKANEQAGNKQILSQKSPVPYHLLDDPAEKTEQDYQWMQDRQQLLEQTLKHFNVHATVVNTTQGPSVTRFEVQPELGVKVSKIKNLSDDIKLNMAAKDIRIEAPIPGKNTIGIEIPNQQAQTVTLQEIFSNDSFQTSTSPLTIGLGLNIEGEPMVTNIQKMPHGLIAGATGSGKSVCINTILISLLYKVHYDDVKFMLIDPKMVELAPFNGIPHLISPVITDVKAATAALKWAVREMEQRYDAFVREGVRNIERFNQKMHHDNRSEDRMPFIVIVIDELADLMMVSPQDVENAISRIAQKARACGIHLLLATQRPSVDVITGLIKANIPTRIAFSVSSQVDSKTILDTGGAERLLGRGDMLLTENGAGQSIRLQGAFVSEEEIERVTDYARSMGEPDYAFEQEHLLEETSHDEEVDELLHDAIQFAIDQNSASTSLLQRHFKIGYNRSARLMDAMEAKGIISEQNGSKPREVLISEVPVDY